VIHSQIGRAINILLVEDNPGDARLTIEAFRDAKVQNDIQVVPDGVEAMSYLRREDKYRDAARPDIILLDLNLPRKDGRQVLEEIKSDQHLRRIPVAVLTTSRAEMDILLSYDLHANCYINKPVDLDEFIRVVRSLENFWLTIVELPMQ
jgi:CheY-like chemotaxis protein